MGGGLAEPPHPQGARASVRPLPVPLSRCVKRFQKEAARGCRLSAGGWGERGPEQGFWDESERSSDSWQPSSDRDGGVGGGATLNGAEITPV